MFPISILCYIGSEFIKIANHPDYLLLL